MNLIEIAVLGIGLAMDAVAVSMTNGMVYKNLRMKEYILMPLFFGVFQGVMPLIGFFAGTLFSDLISQYSGIVIFIILAVIGGNMIRESFTREDGETGYGKKLTLGVLFFQAVATSIDAFAVGVGFCAVKVEIVSAVSVIGAITAVMVVAAILVGKKFGDIFETKAELLGGIILVIIGVKALL